MQPKKIAIVGGNGRYGKFFTDFFGKRGHEVQVSDVGTTPSNEEIVRWADVVLIAVTLLKTVPVIESLVPLLRHDQLVMDITSVKAGPVGAMLASKAEVLGLHPFTAPPKNGTFRGQTMFVVYARLSVWRDWVDEFLLSTEATVRVVEADTHDRERTVDQVLEHMCTSLKVAVMRRLGLDASHLFEVASPVYKLTAVQMARMFAQSADLYGGLPMVNPHAVATLEMFGEEFRHYVEVVKNSDLARYAADFAANRKCLGQDNIEKSFAVSEHVVGLMSDLLESHSFRAELVVDKPGILEQIGSFFREANVSLRAFHSRRLDGKWTFFVAFDKEKSSPGVQSIIKRLKEEFAAKIV